MRYRSFIFDTERWGAYRHRPGDIIITTPPKCGTTWMQNLVGMVVLGTTDFDRPMRVLSPWLDQVVHDLDETVAALDAMAHRRWIKAHAPADALPWHDDITYVVVARDPRDVAVSMDHHLANVDLERLLELRGEHFGFDDLSELPPMPEPLADPVDRFWRWMTVRHEPELATGLQYLVLHLRSWWERRHEPNVVLFHYADLEGDLPGELRRLAKRLGVEVSDDHVRAMAEAGRFESMRARASELAPNAGAWKDDAAFFRRGGSGQWRELIDDDEIGRYDSIIRELTTDEELLSWLHRP